MTEADKEVGDEKARKGRIAGAKVVVSLVTSSTQSSVKDSRNRETLGERR
jgi:hypothetical protein